VDDLLTRRSEKWSAYPPDVLPAWVAEMDFALAPPVRDVLLRAVELGDLGYIGDVSSLLEAMSSFYSRRLGWRIDTSSVSIVGDVIVGLTELLLAHTAPGDTVIINPPCYPPYFHEIPHAGRRIVLVPLRDDGALDLDALEVAFVRGHRVLLLCSPHNPTGRVYTREELEALAALAERYEVLVIADEIHAPLAWVEFTPWLSVSSRGFALTSASKAFNLPALKLGFVVGDPVLPSALRDHAGHLGALAAEAAFREGDVWLDETIAVIAENHARLPSLLPEGVSVAVPAQASYLAWLDCREAGLGDDPAAVFLERGRVALTHGPTFGAQGRGFARLNVGTRPELVEEAARRLASALAR
jgi:cysteine-S-conjugate beta-lyase